MVSLFWLVPEHLGKKNPKHLPKAWDAFFLHPFTKTKGRVGQKSTHRHLKSVTDPKDVHQGSLGDCWLMAALSCLSDHPQKLKSLFGSRHITEDGWIFFPISLR